MNYNSEPLSVLIRGPLLRTPQGLVCLIWAAIYFSGAVAIGFFGVTPPFGWQVDKTIIFCIGWPFIFFLYFIKNNQPSFEASWPAAGCDVFIAAAPVLFALWQT